MSELNVRIKLLLFITYHSEHFSEDSVQLISTVYDLSSNNSF